MKCKFCKKMIKSYGILFCSVRCGNKSRAKNYKRKCVKCKKTFYIHNIAFIKRGGGKYCSTNCGKFATKKYTLNEKFFDKIKTETQAYWLGFLIADAYNSNDALILEIAAKDINHIKKFKKTLKASQPIKTLNRENVSVKLELNSRYMCKALSKLECVKNKSLTVKYPKIPSKLDRHFIRGVFDGDGCISNNRWMIYSASRKFIKKIKSILNKNNIEINFIETLNGYTVSTSKKSMLIKLNKFMYKNSTISLQRKKNRMIIFQ